MTYEFCKTERQGNILVVTLNRPEVYNAMHGPMHDELAKVWRGQTWMKLEGPNFGALKLELGVSGETLHVRLLC